MTEDSHPTTARDHHTAEAWEGPKGDPASVTRWSPGIRPELVLFDLDGTLTDSAPGILDSMRFAFAHHGLAVPDAPILQSFLGPPFARALEGLGMASPVVDDVVATYRGHYNDGGLFNNTPYPGIFEMLESLRRMKIKVVTATSKPQPTARRIAEHFRLEKFTDGGLEGVFGADPTDPRDTKADVIRRALRGSSFKPGPNVVMVGDRHHDVDGARENSLACIGVLWGYGSADELRRAGAVALADSPDELRTFFGSKPQ